MKSLKTIVLVPDWLQATAGRYYSLSDIASLISGLKENTITMEKVKECPLSLKTIYELLYLDTLVTILLSKPYMGCDIYGATINEIKNSLTSDLEKDCKYSVKSFLTGKEVLDCCVTSGTPEPKYYEIQTTSDGTMIIVVKPGFLNYLVESKDNFNKFILECLQLTYDYSASTVDQPITRLLGSYLYYNSSDNYNQIFKANLMSFFI